MPTCTGLAFIMEYSVGECISVLHGIQGYRANDLGWLWVNPCIGDHVSIMSGDFGVNRSKEEIGREGKRALLCYALYGRRNNYDGLDQLKLCFLAEGVAEYGCHAWLAILPDMNPFQYFRQIFLIDSAREDPNWHSRTIYGWLLGRGGKLPPEYPGIREGRDTCCWNFLEVVDRSCAHVVSKGDAYTIYSMLHKLVLIPCQVL